MTPEDELNVMDNYWLMLQECEVKAESENDAMLKLWVEQWYELYSNVRGGNYKPKWSDK